ncbi:uncharacterized protein RSE6_13230 [Rhynchosporium secalis]|uniref:Uncharacterized protein n=1 Tax=Rhynchosporium secalis TaxID=38038 RepID=A0A1E1MSC3_RHYSE|nr:uncharacterized protein RSE6_13230 [Rhynchosporium secalis]
MMNDWEYVGWVVKSDKQINAYDTPVVSSLASPNIISSPVTVPRDSHVCLAFIMSVVEAGKWIRASLDPQWYRRYVQSTDVRYLAFMLDLST